MRSWKLDVIIILCYTLKKMQIDENNIILYYYRNDERPTFTFIVIKKAKELLYLLQTDNGQML